MTCAVYPSGNCWLTQVCNSCVFENTESGHFSIDAVFSQNDGISWNSRKRIYTAANKRESGAPAVINVGGKLVVSFMTNEDVDIPQVDGGQMKVIVSTNGGQSWGGSTVTGDRGSHWPGLLTLGSTEFLALYSQNGKGLISQKYRV